MKGAHFCTLIGHQRLCSWKLQRGMGKLPLVDYDQGSVKQDLEGLRRLRIVAHQLIDTQVDCTILKPS